jgi:hypothetical protein
MMMGRRRRMTVMVSMMMGRRIVGRIPSVVRSRIGGVLPVRCVPGIGCGP